MAHGEVKQDIGAAGLPLQKGTFDLQGPNP